MVLENDGETEHLKNKKVLSQGGKEHPTYTKMRGG
jgi:hypothetical protein